MLTILSGPAHCGKTERLLSRYRSALVQPPPGSTLWLAPTWRAAADVRLRLFDGDFCGCFSPGVMTFEKFAETVLHAARLPIRPLTRLMKRELIRQIIVAQSSGGRLKHFQSIATTGGLVDLICEFISELKRLEIWPEEFHGACRARGIGDKDVELSEIYAAYQQLLREHGLFDAEGRFWSARDALKKAEGGKRKGERASPNVDRAADDSSASSSPFRLPPSALFKLVVLDGFTDFTRTQHEIIEVLAGRAEMTIVTLPLEQNPCRTDLFAKPLKTLAEFRRRHAGLIVEEIARPPRIAWPAMAHLESTLFISPREQAAGVAAEDPGPRTPTAEPSVAGIEILAAARQVGEIELVATRIKRLLVDGEARPGEIAVVFRSPQDVDGLLGEVFGRLGVPVVFESGQTLERSPALRALVALVKLDLDDWPFDQLLAVLGSNYFQPTWREWQEGRTVVQVERTIRQLQIPRGRQQLIGQLAAVGGDLTRRSAAEDVAHRATLAIAQRLAKALDALPERATLADWAKAWQRLAQETGLLRAIDEGVEGRETRDEKNKQRGAAHEAPPSVPPPTTGDPTSSPFFSDRHAWNRLMEASAAAETLAAWLHRRGDEFDRPAAVATLLDILHSERLGHAGDESGYVRVLSASSIRSLRVPYLFLAGLSERVFPSPQRDDRLYSDAEYVRLIDAGLPFAARTERTCEEMLLFYEAITRATKRLYLSYPALDEAAQPLLPSPFLQEVELAFADKGERGEGKGEKGNGAGRIPRTERLDLRPIPPDDEPPSAAECRVKALATALAGNVALLAGLMARGEGRGTGEESGSSALRLPPSAFRSSPAPRPSPLAPVVDNLAAGLELIHLRQERDRFGPAEGVLPSREAHYYLLGRFPSHHTFAATDLERYATCPFRFFLERVLGLQPVEDLALEFDVLNRGRVVHDVLATFHRRVNERLGRPGSPRLLDAAEFDALLAAAIAEAFPPQADNSLQAALAEVDRRLVVEWLAKYRQQLEKYDGLWQGFDTPMAPELFEVSFGRGDQPPPSTDQSFDCVTDGQVVRVSGRIDRIDTGTVAGETVCNVLDYKTGGPISLTPESIKAGTTLQLPLYALAATELLLADRDSIPWQAGYWYIREGGFRPRQALRMYRNDDGRIELESAWEEIRSGLAETVVGLVRSLRRGQFPVCSTDPRCTSHCPFNTICRINQVRSLEKTCQPTASE